MYSSINGCTLTLWTPRPAFESWSRSTWINTTAICHTRHSGGRRQTRCTRGLAITFRQSSRWPGSLPGNHDCRPTGNAVVRSVTNCSRPDPELLRDRLNGDPCLHERNKPPQSNDSGTVAHCLKLGRRHASVGARVRPRDDSAKWNATPQQKWRELAPKSPKCLGKQHGKASARQHPREEPSAVVPLAGNCAGGAG